MRTRRKAPRGSTATTSPTSVTIPVNISKNPFVAPQPIDPESAVFGEPIKPRIGEPRARRRVDRSDARPSQRRAAREEMDRIGEAFGDERGRRRSGRPRSGCA